MYDIIQQWGYFIGKHMDFSSTYMIIYVLQFLIIIIIFKLNMTRKTYDTLSLRYILVIKVCAHINLKSDVYKNVSFH